MQEDDAVHGAADGGVLVRDDDVGGDARARAGAVLPGPGLRGQRPDQVLHHCARHRVQACRRLIVHDHLRLQTTQHIITCSAGFAPVVPSWRTKAQYSILMAMGEHDVDSMPDFACRVSNGARTVYCNRAHVRIVQFEYIAGAFASVTVNCSSGILAAKEGTAHLLGVGMGVVADDGAREGDALAHAAAELAGQQPLHAAQAHARQGLRHQPLHYEDIPFKPKSNP